MLPFNLWVFNIGITKGIYICVPEDAKATIEFLCCVLGVLGDNVHLKMQEIDFKNI